MGVCVCVCWSAVWREGGPSLESHRLLTVDIFADKCSFFFFFFSTSKYTCEPCRTFCFQAESAQLSLSRFRQGWKWMHSV